MLQFLNSLFPFPSFCCLNQWFNESIWIQALLATIFVSVLPNLLLLVFPASWLQQRKSGNKKSLSFGRVLMMFAVAGLLGDVFLHTLPHLMSPHKRHHHEIQLMNPIQANTPAANFQENMHCNNQLHVCGDLKNEKDIHDHDHIDEYLQNHVHYSEDHHHDDDKPHGKKSKELHGHHHHVHEDKSKDKAHKHIEDSIHHHHEGHDHHERDHDHKQMKKAGHEHNHDHECSQHEYEGHIHGMDELVVPLLVLTGFVVFFIAEKVANLLMHSNHDCEDHNCNDSGNNHSHSHEHSHTHDHGHNTQASNLQEEKGFVEILLANLQPSGWLNIFADAMHNFTDGMAIGAAFATGKGLAFAMFLSVIIHEVPHEIGDLTILIHNGLTKTQAIKAQFMTAIAALLGTLVGLYLADNNEFLQKLLLSLTGGGFVYIATVTLVPEITQTKRNQSWMQLLLEIMAFALGIALMVLVAMLE